jgi:hypothetical protein
MRKEITFGGITGLLIGATFLAPLAAYRTEASVPAKSHAPHSLVLPKLPVETPLADYKLIGERNLFGPEEGAAEIKPVEKIKIPVFPLPPPPWVSPLEGWVYAGYFSLDGDLQAILQQPGGQASFVRSGENFLGGQVSEITPERVRITFGKNESILPKSDVFNAAPEAAGGSKNPAPTTGRSGAFRSPVPPRLRPAGGSPVPQPTAAPPAPVSPSGSAWQQQIQQRADLLRAQWEARRRAREQAMRNNGNVPPPPPGGR